MCRWLTYFLLALWLSPFSELTAGDLNNMRKDLHSDSSAKPANAPPRNDSSRHEECHSGSSSHSFNDDDDDLSSQLFGLGLAGVGLGLSSPFWAPYAALSDDLDRNSWFPKHPYEEIDGALAFDETVKGTHSSLIVLQGVYGTDLSDLMLFNGRATLEHSSRFGIDTELTSRTEKIEGGGHDQIWNGDFNVTYRFAQSKHWLFRTGLGVNWLGDHEHVDVGFNFTYGAEWFPIEPLVITGTIDWGRIADAGLFHGRTTIGVTRNGWGVFTGYDHFRISDSASNTWINGIELRF